MRAGRRAASLAAPAGMPGWRKRTALAAPRAGTGPTSDAALGVAAAVVAVAVGSPASTRPRRAGAPGPRAGARRPGGVVRSPGAGARPRRGMHARGGGRYGRDLLACAGGWN